MAETSPFPTATPALQSCPTTRTHNLPGNLPRERTQHKATRHKDRTAAAKHQTGQKLSPSPAAFESCTPPIPLGSRVAAHGLEGECTRDSSIPPFTVRGRSYGVVVRRDKPFLAGRAAEAQRQCEMSGVF
ncbi:hypothetical protein S40293_10437 [Stachybotrys chartarum IBT 40293]|nr:hypothetical protein S40293_10437 [Stachybotrys chartarum IBT 40293]